MEKQISAVEWLYETLTEEGFDLSLHTFEINQAKQMEKEQVIEAYEKGQGAEASGKFNKTGIKYYNKTFKSE